MPQSQETVGNLETACDELQAEMEGCAFEFKTDGAIGQARLAALAARIETVRQRHAAMVS